MRILQLLNKFRLIFRNVYFIYEHVSISNCSATFILIFAWMSTDIKELYASAVCKGVVLPRDTALRLLHGPALTDWLTGWLERGQLPTDHAKFTSTTWHPIGHFLYYCHHYIYLLFFVMKFNNTNCYKQECICITFNSFGSIAVFISFNNK